MFLVPHFSFASQCATHPWNDSVWNTQLTEPLTQGWSHRTFGSANPTRSPSETSSENFIWKTLSGCWNQKWKRRWKGAQLAPDLLKCTPICVCRTDLSPANTCHSCLLTMTWAHIFTPTRRDRAGKAAWPEHWGSCTPGSSSATEGHTSSKASVCLPHPQPCTHSRFLHDDPSFSVQ